VKLAKALHILESDRRLILSLGLLHFLLAAAHSLFDIGVTALLIKHLGPDTLPQVYMGSAIALIFVGVVIIPVIDRLDRAKLFASVLIVFSGVLLISTPFASRAPGFVYRELYIACYLMKSLVFLQFWLLAGDLLDMRQAKRLFPILLGFSLMGGLAASFATALLAPHFATESFLTAAGVLLAAAILPVILVAQRWRGRLPRRRRSETPDAEPRQRLLEDLRVALSNDLLRTLSLCLLFLALLAQVLDFLMGKAADANFGSVDELTSFYAVLNVVVLAVGALVQFTLANRVISAVGVTRGLMLAPLTFLGAFLMIGGVWSTSGGQIARPFFNAVLASRAIQKVLRISLVRTSTDLVYNATPSDRRGRAKAFKETVIEPFGVLLGGVFLAAGTALPLPYALGGALILAVAFLLLTIQLKDYYVESLVHVLKEKSRFRFAFPSIMMRAPQTPPPPAHDSALRRAFENDETSMRLLAVEVASELKQPEAASLLVKHFREEKDTAVKARMLSALGQMVYHRAEGDEASERESLHDRDPRVRASEMSSIAESGMFRIEDLAEASERSDPPAPPKPEATATSLTPSEIFANEKSVKRERFLDLARSGDRRALERLIHYLEEGDGATRHLAARALESCGEPAVDMLTLALWSSDVEGRRYVIRALDRIGSERARQALLPVLSLEAEEAYYDLVQLETLTHLSDEPALALLKDSIVHRVARAKRNAHQILRAVFIAEPGMRLILSNLHHADKHVRASALEALEVRVEPTLLGGILPLFEHENPRVIAEHGSSYFQFPKREPREVLYELTRHRSPWVRACAVYVVGRLGLVEDLSAVEERLGDDYELARLNAIEAIGRLGDETSIAILQDLQTDDDAKTRDYASAAMRNIQKRLWA
jgi:HEAT repeat protein